MVSATIRPPAARARADADSWRGTRSGTEASMVSTFQLTARPAAADMSTSRSISSSANLSRQPATIASICVPGCSPTARQSATSSFRSAWREATGRPSPSEWVEDWVVESPHAPSAIDCLSSATIAANCSGVARPPMASGPMTWRRRAQWPTMKPALTAVRPSSAARYSPKEDQPQGTPSSSAASDIPSTRHIIRRV